PAPPRWKRNAIGAPTSANTRQATAIAYFFWISTSYAAARSRAACSRCCSLTPAPGVIRVAATYGGVIGATAPADGGSGREPGCGGGGEWGWGVGAWGAPCGIHLLLHLAGRHLPVALVGVGGGRLEGVGDARDTHAVRVEERAIELGRVGATHLLDVPVLEREVEVASAAAVRHAARVRR